MIATRDIISSVLYRNFKRSPRYVRSETSDPPFALRLPAGERVIGWYRNPAPWEESIVAFSTDAIHLLDADQTVRIEWADLVGWDMPKSKSDATGVLVKTNSGSHFVRMAGSSGADGQLQDAFCFTMVLRVMVPHAKRDRGQP